MTHTFNTTRAGVLAGLLVAAAGCTPFAGAEQGNLQPQMVSSGCTVTKFYILSHVAVHTTMRVDPSGVPCTFTVLNPDLQAFPSAALVTSQPAHGTVTAGLVNSGRSPAFTYTPQPGYSGPDAFSVTFEPNDHAIAVAVAAR